MDISLFYPGVQPDYHVYEALQIFGDAGITLTLHPGSGQLLIRVTGDNGAVMELTPPDPALTDNSWFTIFAGRTPVRQPQGER